MRAIKHIVVHCTGTRPNATIAAIQNYWRTTMKWKSPGYHYIIEFDGKETQLLTEEQPSNGVAGHNSSSVHVCYIGGVNAAGKNVDTRSDAQKATLLKRLVALKKKYPNAKILGHRDFPQVAKDCPCFNAIPEYAHL